jgi:A/G-specific adenine glycosylase
LRDTPSQTQPATPDAATQISGALLAWYDRHARIMPWRVSPAARQQGQTPDPYRIWLSEVMLQQTTVAAVKSYFLRFTQRWPNVGDLAAAQDGDVMAEWAGLGYYARARNLLRCARAVVQNHGGVIPADHAALLRLPGVGPYTAAAVGAIAFDIPATVVDGNVERVMARLFDVQTPLPRAKPELTAHAARLTPQLRPGDYAQAVMDLGATICTPRKPACGICPLMDACQARHAGSAETLPRKLAKTTKPTRFGTVFIARRSDGAWLLERRPGHGLLGGMLGWPGDAWATDSTPYATTAAPPAPVVANWQSLNTQVRHTFTHFHLVLSVQVAHVSPEATPKIGYFLPATEFRAKDLPTVMRKAHALAATVLQP